MGVAENMSWKEVVFISLALLVDSGLSQLATCNPQNRECSCADMHACGVYIDKNGQQVLLVTGGRDPDNFDSQNRQLPLSSTEVATYTGTGTGSLSWRKVETGDLPLSKYGLMGTVANNVLYVSGGMHDHNVFLTTILFWDPVQELWTKAGDQ